MKAFDLNWGILLVVSLAGCSASPGPPPVEDPLASQISVATSTTTGQPTLQQTELVIGIDQVQTGFNPHLLVDDSRFTRTLASLILPSAFVDGKRNKDLLTNAYVLPVHTSATKADLLIPRGVEERTQGDLQRERPLAFTVRYDIAPEAQWSDGTPITVADFEYLWSSIIATPATLNPSGYRAISAIRSANGGKTVYVDFAQPYDEWTSLFSALLPAHLLRGDPFSEVLARGVPAAAGKFAVQTIDRQRGVFILKRNDRWWGREPARVETLSFREIRSTAQGIEMLNSGQVSFLDLNPTQTSREAYELVPGTQVWEQSDELELEIVANTKLQPVVRQELQSLIDAPTIARLAYERTNHLDIDPTERTPQTLHIKHLISPVRIGVDPSQELDFNAAQALMALLQGHNITATIVQADMTTLVGALIPQGKVDVVVHRTSAQLPERYACPAKGLLGSNISGFCDRELQQRIDAYYAGRYPYDELLNDIAAIERKETLRTSIARGTRLEVKGRGIVGPEPIEGDDPRGTTSLDTWRVYD
ncbi:ABC transporter family substrate-binding protein [Corynebacterium sp. ES2775-CONJ]|uniref:ABC transporter family substrate-binding protein n=1 Tax=Corynebacterium sp. ES2775-CONJ TaxID=2974029 RepID=UPI0021686D75|nr:ABC transporter family substrate-binding protein [Corynebacterium sp. ES2775-CONJ]MCS4489891.1 ABC transporter family substrate-binding protein [Corynebacterium sp. ES2775-CONJ]